MKPLAAFLFRFFLLLLLLHCFFIYAGMDGWRLVSKLMLLPWLMISLFRVTAEQGRTAPLIVYAALLFSFLGDLALTQSGELFFLLGMLAFMLTHICNSMYCIRLQDQAEGGRSIQTVTAALLLVLCIMVYRQLSASLGSLRIPVLVYMFVIAGMAVLVSGVYRVKKYRYAAARWLIPGALLFICSDTLLALNKFSFHLGQMDIMVMLSYGLAQYFLVRGFAAVTALGKENAVGDTMERG